MTDTIVRMGGYQGPPSVHTRAGHILGRELVERTGDGFRFDFTENVTALGRNSMDLFEMVEGEELDICYFAASYLAHRVPNIAVFDLPFQIARREEIYPKLDGALGERLAGDIAAHTGYVLLGYWDNGFRHFTNRLRPLRRPIDCSGIKIRTMNSAVHQAIFAALGFLPKFIDVKDFPAAIRSHEVDAQENPLTNTVNFKVHETHPFLTMTGHFYGVTLVLGNRGRIESWPERAQEALKEAMETATKAQRQFAIEEDNTCLKVLAAAGTEVLRPGSFDRETFVEATKGVADYEAKAIDPDVLALMREG
jgi:C4-dicarboxylate-binding protein DctP